VVQWQAAFFMRSHGMSSGEIGTWLALAYGGVGFLGTYVGGELATRYAAHDERLQLLGTSIAFALLAVLKVGVYVLSDMYWALGALAATSFMAGLSNGPMYSVTQTLVPPHMRAVAIALILLIANLIGAGFGPLIVGVVSDLLRPWAGEESLRYSLLLCCPGYGWAAWHLWKASGSVQRDLPSAAVEPAAGIRIPREPQSELEVGRLHKAT
jgi:MFS family permease